MHDNDTHFFASVYPAHTHLSTTHPLCTHSPAVHPLCTHYTTVTCPIHTFRPPSEGKQTHNKYPYPKGMLAYAVIPALGKDPTVTPSSLGPTVAKYLGVTPNNKFLTDLKAEVPLTRCSESACMFRMPLLIPLHVANSIADS